MIPKYIILEWINWCWKSSVWKEIWNMLTNEWFTVHYKHFPDETTTIWKTIREMITDKDAAKNWSVSWMLYSAESELFHIKNLQKEYDKTIYILDRHPISSSFVYQYEMPPTVRKEVYKKTLTDLQNNWIVFIIDVDINIAIERFTKRNAVIEDINKKNDKYLSSIDLYHKNYLNLWNNLDTLGVKNITIHDEWISVQEMAKRIFDKIKTD